MVNINKKEGHMAKDGSYSPTMWRHVLDVVKDSKFFKSGEHVTCFITDFNNNRFAVWDVDYHHHNKYEVFSESELHEHFQEL